MQFPVPAFQLIYVPDLVMWYIFIGLIIMIPGYVMIRKETKKHFRGSWSLTVIAYFFSVVIWPLTVLVMAHDLIYEWEMKKVKK